MSGLPSWAGDSGSGGGAREEREARRGWTAWRRVLELSLGQLIQLLDDDAKAEEVTSIWRLVKTAVDTLTDREVVFGAAVGSMPVGLFIHAPRCQPARGPVLDVPTASLTFAFVCFAPS